MKKIIILMILTLNLIPLFSAAKSDAPYTEAEGKNNWNYRIDISDSPEGTYNFIVKAVDGAGNESFAGPYNFYVDPDSDLPLATFSYPSQGSRAGSVLNIVGTATDDDGVSTVEIRLDEGDWLRTQGQDFWSYLLDTENIPDGEHLLSVRAQDFNGLMGEEQSVSFILDKSAPDSLVDSHPNGVLLSGKNTIDGTITDANGLAALSLSRDNGDSYEEISFKYDKKEDLYQFSFSFDSREMEDGSYIFWLKSTDTTGSEGILPFQFYVDNQGPELTLYRPDPERAYPGIVPLSGRVDDQIGVASLSYTSSMSKEPTEILLTQGNPYWTASADFTAAKGDRVDVEFLLVDLTGNETSQRLRIDLNRDEDLPLLFLFNQEGASYTGGSLTLYGAITDDDGADSLLYRLDKGEYQEISADSAFSLLLEDLSPGEHQLNLIPRDIYGVEGEDLDYPFTIVPDKPVILLDDYRFGETTEPWQAGLELDPQLDYQLNGRILSDSKPTLLMTKTGSAEVPESSLSVKSTDQPGLWSFTLNIKKGEQPGITSLSLRVEDSFGQKAFQGTSYTMLEKILDADGKTVTGLKNSSPEGFTLSPFQEDNSGFITLTEESGLSGFITGDTLDSVSFERGGEFLEIRVSGNQFLIVGANDGAGENLTLVIETQSGKRYDHSGLNIRTDIEDPLLEDWIESPWEEGQERWKSDTLEIEGSIRDATPIISLAYALNEGTFREMQRFDASETPAVPDELSEPAAEESTAEKDLTLFPFRESIDLGSLEEGFFVLTLRARDSGGNEKMIRFPYIRQTRVPVVTQMTPAADLPVIRETTLSWEVDRDSSLLRAEFSADGENWTPVPLSPRVFSQSLNLQNYPPELSAENLLFRLTDRSGNQQIVSPAFSINREADRPRLEIQAPLADSTVRSDFSVSGYVVDNDSIDAILYRLDDPEGEFIEMEGGNTFSIDLLIDDLFEGDHFIEIQARDRGGILSELVRRDFKVSLKDPETQVTFPLVEDVVRGPVTISGTSSDLNGISEVWISLNNGRNFNRMEGTEEWSYLLDTRLLDNGTHSFLIKAVDGAGTEGIYVSLVNIDNQDPRLELDFPAEGSLFYKNLEVEGRSEEENLVSLVLQIEQNGTLLEERDLELKRVIKEELTTETMEPGTYTLRLEATDSAGNVSFVSRIVQKPVDSETREIHLSFPRKGSRQGPRFTIEGQLKGAEGATAVTLILDGETFATAEVSDKGWYNYPVEAGSIAPGSHSLEALYQNDDGEIRTEAWPLEVFDTGGWLTLDSLASGDYVRDRPWISGSLGYESFPLELESAEDKENQKLQKEWEKIHQEMQKAEVWISLDNGRSFQQAKVKNGQWKYRLETGLLQDGPVSFLAEARFPDGSKSLVEALLQYDKDLPDLEWLNSDVEDGRFNGSLELIGSSYDENGIDELSVILREGDKKRFATPTFIQGLYLDLHTLGISYYDVGIGFTFFDDNVKLQAQFGTAPSTVVDPDTGKETPSRFSGTVIGGKLLANVGNIPLGYFFGPDWEPLSASVALGANFSYFTMNGEEEGKIVGGVLGQLEFPKYSFLESDFLRYLSLYTEGQLWFIPSDVSASIETRLSFGLRLGMF